MKRRALALLPGLLILAAASLLLLVPALRAGIRPVIPLAGYAMTAGGLLLAVRLGSVRVAIGLIILALADQAMQRWAPPGAVAGAAAVLVPLNLAGLAWTSDQGPRWPRVRRWAIILGAQILAVAVLLLPDTEDAARPLWQLVHPVNSRWDALGHPAMTAFSVALTLAGVRFALRPRPVEAGLLWALVAALLAFDPGGELLQTTLYLAAAGLTLSVALVETSHALAYTDELTGLPTRRALNDLLAALGPRWAVGMVDVDHFKKFNDTYGHQAGDQLLRKVGAALTEVGGGGRAFRYGGEEFAVVFSGFMAHQAAPHLEAVRERIAAAAFIVRGRGRRRRKPRKSKPAAAGRKVGVTVSIGVADSTHVGLDPAQVVRAADEALYRAKRAGRNRLAV